MILAEMTKFTNTQVLETIGPFAAMYAGVCAMETVSRYRRRHALKRQREIPIFESPKSADPSVIYEAIKTPSIGQSVAEDQQLTPH